MRDLIQSAIRGHNADYVEVRLEEERSTHIRYAGGELEDIGSSTFLGGNARAVARGGWGFVCFNDLSNLREKVSLAVHQARMVGGEPIRLAPVEPRGEVVAPHVKKDPNLVPLAEKRPCWTSTTASSWVSLPSRVRPLPTGTAVRGSTSPAPRGATLVRRPAGWEGHLTLPICTLKASPWRQKDKEVPFP